MSQAPLGPPIRQEPLCIQPRWLIVPSSIKCNQALREGWQRQGASPCTFDHKSDYSPLNHPATHIKTQEVFDFLILKSDHAICQSFESVFLTVYFWDTGLPPGIDGKNAIRPTSSLIAGTLMHQPVVSPLVILTLIFFFEEVLQDWWLQIVSYVAKSCITRLSGRLVAV